MHLSNVGDKINGHTHNFDHTSILIQGGCVIRLTFPNGSTASKHLKPGDHLLIPSEAEHEVTASQPETIFMCVYSHRTPQGNVSLTDTGWTPAYN